MVLFTCKDWLKLNSIILCNYRITCVWPTYIHCFLSLWSYTNVALAPFAEHGVTWANTECKTASYKNRPSLNTSETGWSDQLVNRITFNKLLFNFQSMLCTSVTYISSVLWHGLFVLYAACPDKTQVWYICMQAGIHLIDLSCTCTVTILSNKGMHVTDDYSVGLNHAFSIPIQVRAKIADSKVWHQLMDIKYQYNYDFFHCTVALLHCQHTCIVLLNR